MSLVSIIVPVYNAEKYIRKCLDSILAQTHTNWEAILVDDGSPDNSGAICDEYAAKDNRFRVIHQENGGVVNARNKAIATANGEHLAFVDSDDYIEPDMLKEMVSLAKRESLDIVWCDAKAIFKEGEKICNIKIRQNPVETIKGLINDDIPGWLPIKIINRKFWDTCGIITDESAVIYEDTFISIQLMACNPRMGIIDKTLYNYVRTNENCATNNVNMLKAEKNLSHIYNYLKQKGLYKTCKKEFTKMALIWKIQILKHDIKKACRLYPFAHKHLKNFSFLNFPFITTLFYWFAFNTGALGRYLFKLHFKSR